VRNTGGLRDTVIDIGAEDGYGLVFNNATVGDITHAVWRACEMYKNKKQFKAARKKMMQLDFSWERSVQQYIDVYQSLKN
jgi:starch synthase